LKRSRKYEEKTELLFERHSAGCPRNEAALLQSGKRHFSLV
jgi:hypothetical protein